jgi:signal transduction histidine kinase
MKTTPATPASHAPHPGPSPTERHTRGRSRLVNQLNEHIRFDALLAELSAVFVNLPADAVDAHVERGLARIVEFLGVERSGLGLYSDDGKELRRTHGYVVPGFPAFPPVVLDHELPWYTEQIRRGRLLRFERLPDDLPAEAGKERAYCAQSGMKSNLAIPVNVGGMALGGIGFASFRTYRSWPDELVQRLRLVADVFANALARKRREEQMHQLRDQLARVGRVTMMGELAAAIAHEINQPLCAIVSNAQAAQRLLGGETAADAELCEVLADIAADGERASAVIARTRGLLQKRQPVRAALDLNDAIREVVALVRHQLMRKEIALRLELAADLAPALGDRVQLQQVTLNLLLNAAEALDHAPAGRREVCLCSSRAAGGGALVTVRDSGPGLTPEEVERVFEPLYTTKPGGMGVGLAISRSILDAHGGRIWAEPNPGGGAAFHFCLPAG